MKYDFKPKGVCSMKICVDIENGVINDVSFTGGCSGNTQGVASLAKGRSIDEVISALEGIRCGFKNTSCPDQLAAALKQIKEQTA